MNEDLAKLAAQAALRVVEQIVKNPKVLDGVVRTYKEGMLRLNDFIMEATGQVNRDTREQAIEKACRHCIRKGPEEQVRVAAFVTALYLQHGGSIRRAAQVGGTLRSRFGVSWFPHIHERELRYALKVDRELEDYIFGEIEKGNTTPDPAQPGMKAWFAGSLPWP